MGRMLWPTKSSTCSMPGVWSALAHNDGAAVIFHSPRSCAHIARQMNLQQHYHQLACNQQCQDIKAPLYSSDLTERHAVFGGADRLRQAIDAVVDKHRPQYIVIANSCVAGVIGEDVQAVAEQAEAHWGIPVMAVTGHGFLDSDYYAGFYQAGRLLIDRFMERRQQEEGTVVLIGDRCHPDGAAVAEIKTLLQGLKLRVHAVFPSYASLDNIKVASSSQLAVIMATSDRSYPWLKQLAENMERKLGTTFVDCQYPLGWQAISNWLTAVGQAAGRPQLAREAIAQQQLRLERQVSAAHEQLAKKRVILCIGRPVDFFSPEWVIDLFEMADMSLERIILLDSLTPAARCQMQQRLTHHGVDCQFSEREDDLAAYPVDLVITTHELMHVQVRQVVLPLLPWPGVAGVAQLLAHCIRLAGRYGRRGGILFG